MANEIQIDDEKVRRIERHIIKEENEALKKGNYSTSQMVTKIKKIIEEETKCYSNQ
jgi:hypothetical protein